MSAPNDIMKSTYSLPSRSQTCEPRPRSSTTGPAVYTAEPRDGEFTPSISDCCARLYHSLDRARAFVDGLTTVFSIAQPVPAKPPPSTTSDVPVTKDEASLARNR